MTACVCAGQRPAGAPLAEGRCDRIRQRHHVIPRRFLKRQRQWWASLTPERRAELGLPARMRSYKKLKDDPRGQVDICGRHHQWIENRRIYLRRRDWPEGLEDFAGEVGLLWFLERSRWD